jgi:hypothetical protein
MSHTGKRDAIPVGRKSKLKYVGVREVLLRSGEPPWSHRYLFAMQAGIPSGSGRGGEALPLSRQIEMFEVPKHFSSLCSDGTG